MISQYDFWLNISILGLGTFLIRSSIISLSSRIRISQRIKELFSFIPAAVLPALAIPPAFFHQGGVELLHNKERLFVLILSITVCVIFRNMLVTITFGLGALYLVTQLLG